MTDYRLDEPLKRARAIRAKCIECCAGSPAEVRRCHLYDCTLWPWRLGRKNPPGERGTTQTEAVKG